MTDDALRATERALVSAPADLELRRRHARLLQRAGQAERALSALDLAWRLGAEELWDELRGELDARAVRAGGLELRYVPAGPFVMGSDDHDEDARPAHLVELSAFFLASRPLTYAAVDGTSAWESWMDGCRGQTYPLARSLDDALQLTSQLGTPRLSSARQDPRRPARPIDPCGALRPCRVGLPTEAQWERAQRARLLRPDGVNPYGVEPALDPEWTADRYAADGYAARGALTRDPIVATAGALQAVRGADLPLPDDAFYRDAVAFDGTFQVDRQTVWTGRDMRAQEVDRPASARSERGILLRLCVVPGASP